MTTRWYRRAGGTLAAVATALSVLIAVPQGASADPQPTIAQVEQRLSTLQQQAGAANEQLLGARVALQQGQTKLAQLNARVTASQARVDSLRGVMGQLASAAYRSGGMDQTVQLLLSDSAGDFLAEASMLEGVSRRQDDVFRSVATAQQRLAQDKLAAAQQVAQLQKLQNQASQAAATLKARVADAKKLLASLKEAQRRRLEAIRRARAAKAAAEARAAARAAEAARISRSHSRSYGSSTGFVSSGNSSLGAAAARWALGQVGHPYVYGASGPYAFDCSGLTMMAYRSVGISLPHFSGAQWGAGRHVSSGQLQAGDLVFYYSPNTHVGMYIGGGMIVQAANPGEGVVVSPLYSMPYVGAVRPY